jgi:hypothetical protein
VTTLPTEKSGALGKSKSRTDSEEVPELITLGASSGFTEVTVPTEIVAASP